MGLSANPQTFLGLVSINSERSRWSVLVQKERITASTKKFDIPVIFYDCTLEISLTDSDTAKPAIFVDI